MYCVVGQPSPLLLKLQLCPLEATASTHTLPGPASDRSVLLSIQWNTLVVPYKLEMVTRTCNVSTWGVEVRHSGVLGHPLGHPQVHHEFKTILGCTRSCFKEGKKEKTGGVASGILKTSSWLACFIQRSVLKVHQC